MAAAKPQSPSGTPPSLRADARRNRDRIVRAAREVFTSRGIDAPLSAVARRAEVGLATLHRRFPRRELLVAAAFDEQFGSCTGAVDAALADSDPWRGLQTLVHTVCELQVSDRGFTQAFLATTPHGTDSATIAAAEHGLGELVRRCRESGGVRADLTADDITLALIANAGLVARLRAPQRASARLVGQLLRAFSASGETALPPAPGLELRPLLAASETGDTHRHDPVQPSPK
ncbi:TetR/AcrR family transcriptional regulator [Tsukamurella sp. 1534]|uniref:TetR/AcrR family transcriptional regulator n=1 Tax=Tsukamurella sp. 1534 TaxID=1151061 RepID=UPI0002E82BA2|nr:TetR/AcrR family transcriptional regulator [Tsukamurella sp. 1534]